ncbi:uncharacterized protein BX663DRAFT_519189 [Cokeromyces recurvatus]|uniref:uncharacterized protein n=1 Tax=Cokeromyces recurvatus TaxID=90255 RepID=UPI00221E8FE4|nr:uncharacterized protein BX663DRAFT_519189 [Cokeromyces recurvatus]KAI7899980.1 hypothetical protein BX663DRAFT_519189 [Cokeromyces recurvatus]
MSNNISPVTITNSLSHSIDNTTNSLSRNHPLTKKENNIDQKRQSIRAKVLMTKKGNKRIILSKSAIAINKRELYKPITKAHGKKRIFMSVPSHIYNHCLLSEKTPTVAANSKSRYSFPFTHTVDKDTKRNSNSKMDSPISIHDGSVSTALTVPNSPLFNVANSRTSNGFLFLGTEMDFSIITDVQEELLSPTRTWFDEQVLFTGGLPSPEASFNNLWD